MKLNKNILRELIREAIEVELDEEPQAFTVTMKHDKTDTRRTVHVWNGAVDKDDAGRRAKSTSTFWADEDWKVEKVEEKNLKNTVEEASSKQQRKWACAQAGSARKRFKGKPSLTKKQAAEFCADTKLSGKKKSKKKK